MLSPLSRRWARLGLLVLLWPSAGVASADDRSTELFLYRCSNDLGRRDVTLFANGTVRLRQGLWDEQELYLDELVTEELVSYVQRLHGIQASADASHSPRPPSALRGAWVDECEIVLDLPSGERRTWKFSALDMTPLVVSRLIQVAEELAGYTKVLVSVRRVPADYEPHRGDVLRSATGGRFRVLFLTADGHGVELEGLDSPVRMLVPLSELSTAFEAVEELARR